MKRRKNVNHGEKTADVELRRLILRGAGGRAHFPEQRHLHETEQKHPRTSRGDEIRTSVIVTRAILEQSEYFGNRAARRLRLRRLRKHPSRLDLFDERDVTSTLVARLERRHEIDVLGGDGGDEEIRQVVRRVVIVPQSFKVGRRVVQSARPRVQRPRVHHPSLLQHQQRVEIPERLRRRRVNRRDDVDAVVRQSFQHLHDAQTRRAVQPARRFVEKQHIRIRHERQRHVRAFTLPSGDTAIQRVAHDDVSTLREIQLFDNRRHPRENGSPFLLRPRA